MFLILLISITLAISNAQFCEDVNSDPPEELAQTRNEAPGPSWAELAGCGAENANIVIKEWIKHFGSFEKREELSKDLWANIFRDHPDWPAKYFPNVGADDVTSVKFRAHANRIMTSLDLVVTFLEFPELLKANLQHLSDQHVGYGLPAEVFDLFHGALLQTVQQRVGDVITMEAWRPCIQVIEDGIKSPPTQTYISDEL